MQNCEKSQILMLSLIAVLLIITPLLSSSVRTTYLYFITNLLIIALGAQAGLLQAFSKPVVDHDKKNPVSVPQKPVFAVPSELASSEKTVEVQNREYQRVSSECSEKKATTNNIKDFEKAKSQKITGTRKMESVRKCPSMPSLFFIGGGETETEGGHDHDDVDVDVEDYHHMEEDEDVADLSGQELLIKAETFIGNFYKQLKMQREDSWKRIHGFYQKAF